MLILTEFECISLFICFLCPSILHHIRQKLSFNKTVFCLILKEKIRNTKERKRSVTFNATIHSMQGKSFDVSRHSYYVKCKTKVVFIKHTVFVNHLYSCCYKDVGWRKFKIIEILLNQSSLRQQKIFWNWTLNSDICFGKGVNWILLSSQ